MCNFADPNNICERDVMTNSKTLGYELSDSQLDAVSGGMDAIGHQTSSGYSSGGQNSGGGSGGGLIMNNPTDNSVKGSGSPSSNPLVKLFQIH